MEICGCFTSVQSLKLQTGTKQYYRKWIVFVGMLEILKVLTNSSQRISLSNKSFAFVIRNLPSFSEPTFRFEGFFNKNHYFTGVR